jgi:hypothetical protein
MALSKRVKIKYEVDSKGAKRGLDQIAKSTESVRAKSKQTSAELRGMGSAAGGANKGITGLSAGLGRAATAAGTTAAAVAAVSIGFAEVADRAAKSQIAIDNLPFSINRARGATMGLVDDLTLQTSAITANRLGVSQSEADFARLASAATKLGLSVGQDANKSVQDLTTALARQSPMILDNLGITLKVSEANQIYAQRIGKVASELTDAERKQAFMTIGLERAEEAAAKTNIRLDQSAQFILELKTQAINAGNYLSRGFVGALSNASNALDDLIGDITGLNDELATLDAQNGGRAFSFFNPNFAENVERAKELERSRRAQVADAEEMANLEAEVAAWERQGFETQLNSLKLQIAGTTNQKELNRLLAKEANLKATILELDGRGGEADKVLFDDLLRQQRFRARRRSSGSRDKFAKERVEFQRQLTEAVNAERMREFGEATSLQRTYLQDVQKFQSELELARAPEINRIKEANAELERKAGLEMAANQRAIELAQVNGDPATAFALEQEQFRMREEALQRQLELEKGVGDQGAIQDELAQVRHERAISRTQELTRQREESARAIQNTINTVSAAEKGAFQLSSTLAGGLIENERKRKRALDAIKAGELFADGTISIARGSIAVAAGNIPQGLAQIAAGTNAIAQAGIIAAGNARGGGAAASSAGTATQFSRGAAPERADFSIERGAPISVQEGVERNPNNTGPAGGRQSTARSILIERIDVLGAIDDDSARKISDGIKRAEANLGV